MKKCCFILLIASAPTLLYAQPAPQQGVITYDLTLQLRAQVAKKNPALAAMVPEQTHITLEVPFRNEVFAILTKENNASRGDVQVKSGGNEKHIINLKTHSERTEQRFNKRKYYTEKLAAPNVVINHGRETKVIAGYTCNKASVTTADKKQFTVWYTTAIPYAYNPQGLDFTRLKGAVLEYGNDEQTCRAISINPKSFTVTAITPDPAAKKITEEQMQDLAEDASGNDQPEAPQQRGAGRQRTETYRIRL